MAGGPSSRIKYIIIPIIRLIDKFKWIIFLLSLSSLSFLVLLKDRNFILTHSLLSESALDKVDHKDIAFSSRIQPFLESKLRDVQLDESLSRESHIIKSNLSQDYSIFIPFDNIEQNLEFDIKIPKGYLDIAERIRSEVDNIDIYFHRFIYENRFRHSIFIILKCKRCVPYFSNLTVSTMDKDSTFAASLLLGVMSSLSDKSFLSQNHYYLLIDKDLKYTRAVSSFLYSYNHSIDTLFQKYQIHLSHVLDFDSNCTNTIYLHYEGLNGYKPPLDWTVAVLKEFIRHGIDIQTLPVWESIRRQAFNTHLHEQHSTLMEFGIPSFTIYGKCSKNKPYSRDLLLRALHVLARDQGNMDESMDECENYYTFVSNKHFLHLPIYLIPIIGLLAISLHHILSKPHSRNPKAVFYGLVLYIINIIIIGLVPYLIITSKIIKNKFIPSADQRVSMAIAYLFTAYILTCVVNLLVTKFNFKFQIFDKIDDLDDGANRILNKIKMVFSRALDKIHNLNSFKKIIGFLQKFKLTINTNTNTNSNETDTGIEFVGIKTMLDTTSRLYCLVWIIGTMLYNPAQALWLILVLIIPLISPIINTSNTFNWNFCILYYYFHVILLYLPLPSFLKLYRIIYIEARNKFFKSIYTCLTLLPFIPKDILDILLFYGNGGFYTKSLIYEPIKRLTSIANSNTISSYEFIVNFFLLYPFWFVNLWLKLKESINNIYIRYNKLWIR